MVMGSPGCFMGKLRTLDSILRWEMSGMFLRRVTSNCSKRITLAPLLRLDSPEMEAGQVGCICDILAGRASRIIQVC